MLSEARNDIFNTPLLFLLFSQQTCPCQICPDELYLSVSNLPVIIEIVLDPLHDGLSW